MSNRRNKIYLGFLVCLSLSLASCQRFVPTPTQADYFIKLYGGRFPDQGLDILAHPDGTDFVLLGTTRSSTPGDADILLLRLDSLGNEQNSTTINVNGLDQASSLFAIPDQSGFVVAGFSEQANGTNEAVVARLDWNLGPVWQNTTISPGEGETLSQLIVTPDNFVIAVGTSTTVDVAKNGSNGSRLATDLSDVWIVKLALASGELIWEKRYGFTGIDEGLAVREFQGEYHILATTDHPEAIPGDDDLLLFRINGEGNLLDQFVIEIDDQHDYAADFQLLPEGDWVILSSAAPFGSPNQLLQLHRVGADFVVQDQFLFNTIPGSAEAKRIELLPDNEGLVISASLRTSAMGSSDLLLVRSNLSGNLLWSKSFGNGTGDDTSGGLLPLEGESVLLCGTLSYENDNTMACLIKTEQAANGDILP